MNRKDLLEEAIRLTTQKRDEEYGTPNANFARTAKFWSAWKGIDFDAVDVAVFMTLVKISRLRHDPTNADSWTDGAAYLGCGGEVARALTSEEKAERKAANQAESESR